MSWSSACREPGRVRCSARARGDRHRRDVHRPGRRLGARRQGVVDAGRPGPRRAQRARRGWRRQPRPARARHHRRHQCADPAHGWARGAGDHTGLRRHHRDRPAGPPVPLRPARRPPGPARCRVRGGSRWAGASTCAAASSSRSRWPTCRRSHRRSMRWQSCSSTRTSIRGTSRSLPSTCGSRAST